mgnify:CR=1 FL=1
MQTGLKAGDKIEAYIVEKTLGSGAFGITYLASDPALGKKFAIKEYFPRTEATRLASGDVAAIDPSHADAFNAGLDRFLNEARTLAHFDDPAIVRVNRILRQAGTAYIVMEFVDGETLSAKLKRDKHIPAAEAKRLLLKIADGLGSVHEAGILHRDIKPGNILLRNGTDPVLIDFGAAKSAAPGDPETMTAIWTPGFGAKEQMSEYEKEGPYTDVYGLAAVGYCMITGKRPLDASNRFPEDPIEKLGPLGATPLERALFEAIDWGMEPYKEKRPQKLDHWSAKFRSVADGGEAVAAQPAPAPEPAADQPPAPNAEDVSAGDPVSVSSSEPLSQGEPQPVRTEIETQDPQRRKVIVGAALLLSAAAVVLVAVLFSGILPGSFTHAPSAKPEVAAIPVEREAPIDVAASPPPPPPAPERVEQVFQMAATSWTRVDLPAGMAAGQFGFYSDQPYRLRVGDRLFVHPGGARPMQIGLVDTGFVEVKAVSGSGEFRLVYDE